MEDPQYEKPIDLKRPLNRLPPAARHDAKVRGCTSLTKIGRPKIRMPKHWREVIYAICCRPFQMEDIAAQFGMSVDTLIKRRREMPEIDQCIAQARASMHKRLIDPVFQRAMDGHVGTAQWLLEKEFPEKYGPRPQGGGVHVNVGIQNLPRAMSPDEYKKLFAVTAEVAD